MQIYMAQLPFMIFWNPKIKGKKVYICNGSACLAAGTQEKAKNEVLKHWDASEVGEMCCLGRCHENAAFHVDGKIIPEKHWIN